MRIAPFLLGFATLAVPAAAAAYQCTPVDRTPDAVTQVWMSRCIPYAISSNSEALAGEFNRNLVADAFAVWSKPGCSDITFMDTGYTTLEDDFDPDSPARNLNVITSIDTMAELSAKIQEGMWTEDLVAVTFTRYAPSTGEIVDADIVLNAATFVFEEFPAAEACAIADPRHDLRNTMVHEIGHLLGFDHVALLDATMYERADACEVKKRDLHDDEITGLCSVYGVGMETATCVAPVSYSVPGVSATRFRNQCMRFDSTLAPGGCSCSASDAPGDHFPRGATAGLIAMLLLTLIRRRRG